jgi:DNA-binding transcriptional LysR family regulator
VDLSIVALRSLYEISQRGTMTAAAEALGYTPGAVSQHVASLSRAVGRPVVVQSGRSVRLTDAGLILLEHARRVIESEAVVDRELQAQVAEVAGTLTLGIFGSSAVILEQALPGLRTDYPALRVEVRELRETTHENPGLAVSRGDVDLALGLDYPDAPVERLPDVEHRVLATERFGVAGLAPGEGDDSVALADLAALDWVIPPPDSAYGQAVRAACRRAGFEPRATHLATDTAFSLRLAAAGVGITPATPLMMRFAGPPGCHWRELAEPVTRDVLLVVRPGDLDRPSVAAVAEALAEAVDPGRSTGVGG